MARFFTDEQVATLDAVLDRLIPDDEDPGARAAGVGAYIDGLLAAFTFDPPRIWAGGPFSGRFGGEAGFATFHTLTATEELAWRTRIEGSRNIAERERLGPVLGWQEQYLEGLARLGEEFATLDPAEQDARLEADPVFTRLVYEHACEGMYGAPEYGGNRELIGWRNIGYLGDVQPRGYSDVEVSGP